MLDGLVSTHCQVFKIREIFAMDETRLCRIKNLAGTNALAYFVTASVTKRGAVTWSIISPG
jgi:hypothetical protein